MKTNSLTLIAVFFVLLTSIACGTVLEHLTPVPPSPPLPTTVPPASTPVIPAQSPLPTTTPVSAALTCAESISGEGFHYYQIMTGPRMTDATCDRMVQEIQATFDKGEKPPTIVRVYSYPTSPIICSKAYSSGSTIIVVDTNNPPSAIAQGVCNSLP